MTTVHSLFDCGQTIECNRTLGYYGIKNYSVLKLNPKLRGGNPPTQEVSKKPNKGASKKLGKRRHDEQSSVQETLRVSKKPRKCEHCGQKPGRPSRMLFADPLLDEYILNHGSSFIKKKRIPSMKRKGSKIWRGVGSAEGITLCISITEILKKAAKAKRSWDGKIGLRDFRVVDGRAILIKPTNCRLNSLNFRKDCKCFSGFIRKILGAAAAKLFYMKDLLHKLDCASKDDIYWLLDYVGAHLALKTNTEWGKIIRQIMVFHDGLDKSAQKNFMAAVNCVRCPSNWSQGRLQKHFIFRPNVAYRKRRNWPAYEKTSFGCFKCLRNNSTHGCALADYAGPMLLGNFVCDVIRELLMHKYPIQEALGI